MMLEAATDQSRAESALRGEQNSPQSPSMPFALNFKTTGRDLPPIAPQAADATCWEGAVWYGGSPEAYGYTEWQED